MFTFKFKIQRDVRRSGVFWRTSSSNQWINLVITPSVLVIMKEITLPQHPSHNNEDIPDSW